MATHPISLACFRDAELLWIYFYCSTIPEMGLSLLFPTFWCNFCFPYTLPILLHCTRIQASVLCMLLNALTFPVLTVKHVFEWPSTCSLVNIKIMGNRGSTPLWNMTLSSCSSQCTDLWSPSSILSTGTELISFDKTAEFESCHSNSSTAEC
jgi:hypothetical protein